MTAYSMTITNTVRTLGEGPPSLWNAYNWNAFKWGEGTAKIPMRFLHVVPGAPIVTDSARYFRFTHLVATDPIVLASVMSVNFIKQIVNTVTLSDGLSGIYLIDASGYYHVFPGGVTNAVNRDDSSWAAGSASSTAWTPGTASSPVWSAA